MILSSDVGHLPVAGHRAVSSQALVQSFVAPPGKVCLLYGDSLIFQISLRMAASAMAQGNSVAVVDGCNRFNVHLLSRFARERRLDPDEFLRRIFISRGFTCYQMEQAVSSRLPLFLESIGSNIAMIFGLLDTFYDEQASFREVQQILRRLLGTLQDIKASGVSVLSCWHARSGTSCRRSAINCLRHSRPGWIRFTGSQTMAPIDRGCFWKKER
ncbi:MAG: hypothetical protein HW407_1399 [Bacteroidetes bacterium]|nr:hypothetical protein [Bacteroidota bacterium]